MGVLGRGLALAVATLAGCYSPALRDCTIACASGDDCAGSQVCGSDGLCAAPGVAGKCAIAMPGPDAEPPIDAMVMRDAPAVDATPPIDAGPTVQLRVQIEGKGSVVVTGVGTCSSEPPQKGDCTYTVPSGAARSAHAVTLTTMEMFTRWSSLVCGGQGATCAFTPILFTSISAKFDKAHVQ